MKVEDLLRRFAGGQRDFAWADLSGADLARADLAGINLYGANLSQAVLTGAKLHRANLLKANLTGADLTGADLTIANLRKANLTQARLDGADLTGANLAGATAPDGQLFPAPEPVEPEEAPLEPSAEPPLEPPVPPKLAPNPIAPPAPAQRGKTTWTEFRDHLPWPTLLVSTIGFGLFGLLLLLHQAPIVSWWIVWAIALVGTLGEAQTWLVPIVPAVVVVAAEKAIALRTVSIAGVTTLWQFFLVGVTVPALFCCLKFLMNFTWKRSLQDSLVVGGLGLSLVQLFVWTISGRWVLSLLFLLAIGCTGLGAIAWMQMQSAGFSRLQSRWTVAIVAAIGLAGIRLFGAVLR